MMGVAEEQDEGSGGGDVVGVGSRCVPCARVKYRESGLFEGARVS